ncbi:hypothetical protein BLA29_014756 [Euroglyphus maynei]|uniref:Uncharacterized protein n=1 Tax=Euroglyphus maynei TaxID=6958 RepID=A0A1Y3APS7_EURMA|nr:hypothetical protein BLA29_014756 [Euroglyphus maynei]
MFEHLDHNYHPLLFNMKFLVHRFRYGGKNHFEAQLNIY